MTEFRKDEELAEAVAMLLVSRLDYLPAVKISTGLLGALPGAQASRWVPCEECAGCGRVRGTQACVICRDALREGNPIKRPRHRPLCGRCPHCEGDGQRPRRSGEEGWDAYSGRTMAELAAMPMGEVRSSGSEPLAPGEVGWLRERERLLRAGSYSELERALSRLPPGRRDQILAWAERGGHDEEGHAVNGLPQWWSVEARLSILGTLELLAAAIGRPIRVPGWAVRAWKGRVAA